jgi:hypothetical protein
MGYPVGGSPFERDARRKLPLAKLGTGEECQFSAMIAWEIDTALNCVISWRDLDGGRRHEEIVLHV